VEISFNLGVMNEWRQEMKDSNSHLGGATGDPPSLKYPPCGLRKPLSCHLKFPLKRMGRAKRLFIAACGVHHVGNLIVPLSELATTCRTLKIMVIGELDAVDSSRRTSYVE
jgi:hypothetical protein